MGLQAVCWDIPGGFGAFQGFSASFRCSRSVSLDLRQFQMVSYVPKGCKRFQKSS